jgi:hypothetical protein
MIAASASAPASIATVVALTSRTCAFEAKFDRAR